MALAAEEAGSITVPGAAVQSQVPYCLRIWCLIRLLRLTGRIRLGDSKDRGWKAENTMLSSSLGRRLLPRSGNQATKFADGEARMRQRKRRDQLR